MIIIQSIRTKNDSSGNPRKLLLVYKQMESFGPQPELVKVIKYSYGFPKGYNREGIIGLASHEVTPSDYHATIRYAKLAGILEMEQ